MKARLNTLMGQTQQELNNFGDTTFLGEQHRVRLAPCARSIYISSLIYVIAFVAGIIDLETDDGICA
jgi:hypothetical protein